MTQAYVIAIDVHSHSCHTLVTTPGGRRREERTLATSVPALREVVRKTPRPRHVVFEEGPLSGWLYRNLYQDADAVVSAETRRNYYIARDGDKSDAIDAAKLAQLYRGGFVRPVHHAMDAQQASFKALVLHYRRCVREQVARAQRVIWALRGEGVVIVQKHFADAAERAALLAEFKRDRAFCFRLRMLLEDYDQAVAHADLSREELIERGKAIPAVCRFREMPGVGWVRGATFYALIDTPFRFPRKEALWRYVGIGLRRRSSGSGREVVKTTQACNHHLKDVILAAAKDAAGTCRENPFQQQYRRCLTHGHSPRIARRTVARAMVTTLWGMWKSNTPYRPDWVGIPSGQLGKRILNEHR